MQHEVFPHRLSSSIACLHVDVSTICAIAAGGCKCKGFASVSVGFNLFHGDQLHEGEFLVAVVGGRHDACVAVPERTAPRGERGGKKETTRRTPGQLERGKVKSDAQIVASAPNVPLTARKASAFHHIFN